MCSPSATVCVIVAHLIALFGKSHSLPFFVFNKLSFACILFHFFQAQSSLKVLWFGYTVCFFISSAVDLVPDDDRDINFDTPAYWITFIFTMLLAEFARKAPFFLVSYHTNTWSFPDPQYLRVEFLNFILFSYPPHPTTLSLPALFLLNQRFGTDVFHGSFVGQLFVQGSFLSIEIVLCRYRWYASLPFACIAWRIIWRVVKPHHTWTVLSHNRSPSLKQPSGVSQRWVLRPK